MRLYQSVLFIICLCFSSIAFADTNIDFFSEPQIFNVPLANPRSPGDIAFSINTSKHQNQRIVYLEGIIGRVIPLSTLSIDDWKIQLGIEGSVWITLGYKDKTFPLLTEDFLIGLPLSFRYKRFSGALAYNHISAHIGDGLTEEDNIGLSLSDLEPYSRDFLSLYLSYEYTFDDIESRIYSHIGYAHKMVPKELGRSFFGMGFEAKYSCRYLIPYYSQDVTWNGDNDSVDYSYQLGVYIFPNKDDIFTVRIATTGFVGYDRRGQLMNNKIKKFGFGLFIR